MLLSGAPASSPLFARAQQSSSKIPAVGVLYGAPAVPKRKTCELLIGFLVVLRVGGCNAIPADELGVRQKIVPWNIAGDIIGEGRIDSGIP